MYQQVRNYKYRIILIFSDVHSDYRTVFLRNNAVKCKRKRNPLVFLNTAIVVGIQIGKFFVLVQRVLLDINPWRVNVCPQDVHACFQRLLSDMENGDCFVHAYGIDLIAGF